MPEISQALPRHCALKEHQHEQRKNGIHPAWHPLHLATDISARIAPVFIEAPEKDAEQLEDEERRQELLLE